MSRVFVHSANRGVLWFNGNMQSLGEIIRERNIELDAAFDPVSRGGFTQVPNFILENPDLTLGAKVVYAMFLRYAWHNDLCFPGQEKLGSALGMSRQSVSSFIIELGEAGLVTIQRRGQGKTNLYKIHFQVKWKRIHKNAA